MSGDRKKGHDDLDTRNKEAPQINPEKSGIRSGNPQLDPERARKEKARSNKPAGAGAPPKESPSED